MFQRLLNQPELNEEGWRRVMEGLEGPFSFILYQVSFTFKFMLNPTREEIKWNGLLCQGCNWTSFLVADFDARVYGCYFHCSFFPFFYHAFTRCHNSSQCGDYLCV